MNTGLCLTAVAIVDNFGIKAQSLVFVMGTDTKVLKRIFGG
ncbi:MAG: hypothetical protein QN720_08240 [Nitrososphaeraceae archaeon]|jgi:hypothetical protein|nr:hypothetical protein [Nitrososphaeraceae archaeon]MDW0333873.1 hypothetical protein [Nitrososphaeraceae archaeon]